jgi:hypothetical protein
MIRFLASFAGLALLTGLHGSLLRFGFKKSLETLRKQSSTAGQEGREWLKWESRCNSSIPRAGVFFTCMLAALASLAVALFILWAFLSSVLIVRIIVDLSALV